MAARAWGRGVITYVPGVYILFHWYLMFGVEYLVTDRG